MTDTPYLIAHKVRGEAAFDIAIRQPCAICRGIGHGPNETGYIACDECDGEGYWWICSTSGHRAYPYFWCDLNDVLDILRCDYTEVPPMPEGLPDHYPCNKSPEPKGSLLARLGMLKPSAPITRRF